MEVKTLNHSKWEYKYHVAFIQKYRRKTLYKELRPHFGDIFKELAKRKKCKVEEGHVMVGTCKCDLYSAEVCRCAGCWIY